MSVTTPVIPEIAKTRSTAFPQFVFEWHPTIGKVYVVEIPGRWESGQFCPDLAAVTAQGTCIAEHCEHHARFLGCVQTWLRGVKKGQEIHGKVQG